MAHFALLDENNVVQQVIVVDNNNCGGGDFPESEPIGQQFVASLGIDLKCVQTSYNANFRKKYAGIGYIYNKEYDAFIIPQPYQSWTLDENADWKPPIPMPETGGPWEWNEELGNWEEIVIEDE